MTSTPLATAPDATVARLLPSAVSSRTLRSSVQGALALDLDLLTGPEAAPFPIRGRVTEGSAADDQRRLVAVSDGPTTAPACRPWARRFALAVVDVLQGDRSPQQLVRCTSRRVYDDLVRRATAINRASTPEQRRTRLRAAVHSVHTYSASATATEVAIHVRQGHRGRAIAARLEYDDGRWVCTALEFG